jgi:hypothetical protein
VVAFKRCSCTAGSASIQSLKKVTYPGSESGDGSIGVHEGIVLVDTLHVLHSTEWSVSLNPILLIEPSRHLNVKVPSWSLALSVEGDERLTLVIGTLSTAVEVLASVLGDPDVVSSLVSEVLDVLLESLDGNIVPMERQEAMY